MKYYKIVNPEGHNGMIYHEGINVDQLEFKTDKSSHDGGIYFAKKEIFAFLNYGTELYEVEPVGEVIEPYSGGSAKVYKAHTVNLKYIGKVIDNIEFLIKQGAYIDFPGSALLNFLAGNNKLRLIKRLYKKGVDMFTSDAECAYYNAISNNNVNVAKFFLDKNWVIRGSNYGIQLINRLNRTEILEYIRELNNE